MRRWFTCGVVVAVTALGVATSADAATSGPQMAAWLSQQRAANGIPPVADDAKLDQGCADHARYMADNGELVHSENPANPGYTTEGDESMHYGGDYSEVIAPWDWWSATKNNWDAMPKHLDILFDPTAEQVGYGTATSSDGTVYACGRVLPYERSFASPTFFAYTGDRGRTDVPTGYQVDGESGESPQEAVGLPYSQETGFQLLLFAEGFNALPNVDDLVVSNASLTASSSGAPVQILVDDVQKDPGMWEKAVIIPEPNLRPHTRYKLAVTWKDTSSGASYRQAVAFTTGAATVTGCYQWGCTARSFPSCLVPKLTGKTRGAARSALEKAHCALGKVRRTGHSRSQVVRSQSPVAGSLYLSGTRVSVRESRRRRSQKKHA